MEEEEEEEVEVEVEEEEEAQEEEEMVEEEDMKDWPLVIALGEALKKAKAEPLESSPSKFLRRCFFINRERQRSQVCGGGCDCQKNTRKKNKEEFWI